MEMQFGLLNLHFDHIVVPAIMMKKIGYLYRLIILIKINRDKVSDLENWLMKSEQVNNLIRTDGEWDFVVEALFESVAAAEQFTEDLKEDFEWLKYHDLCIMKDLKQEGFSILPKDHQEEIQSKVPFFGKSIGDFRLVCQR